MCWVHIEFGGLLYSPNDSVIDRCGWTVLLRRDTEHEKKPTKQKVSVVEDKFTDAFTYSKQQRYNVLVYITAYTIKSMK